MDILYQFHFHQIKQLDKWIFFPFQQVPCCATAGSTQINCLTRLCSFIIVYIKCLGVGDATQVGPAAVLQRGEEGGVLLGGDRHQGRVVEGEGGGGRAEALVTFLPIAQDYSWRAA